MRAKIEHLNEIYPSVIRDLHCLDLVVESGKFDFQELSGRALFSCAICHENHSNGKMFFEDYQPAKECGFTRSLFGLFNIKPHSFELQKECSFRNYMIQFGHSFESSSTGYSVRTNTYEFVH